MRRVPLLVTVLGLGLALLLIDSFANGSGGLGGGVLVRLGTAASFSELVTVQQSTPVAQSASALWVPPPPPQLAAQLARSPPPPPLPVVETTVATTTTDVPTTTTIEKPKEKYGFYLHVFRDPQAVIFQVRELKKFFPTSPVYIMSDGGVDFSPLCVAEACTFTLCPPANDRWHPWPFFRRIWDAAVVLETEYVIMLEPDNTIHGPITREPKADAGGLYVQERSFGHAEYVEALAQERVPGYKWTRHMMQAGLAGGSYFRRAAILDAFSDEVVTKIDWNWLGEHASKEIYSSDFAMQYALAARGYTIEPWDDSAQMDRDKDKPLTGKVDSAFRHYCGCYPGGKPTYNYKLAEEDKNLFKEAPEMYRRNSGHVCQLCYNLTKYIELYGSARCTINKQHVYTDRLMYLHHPELKDGCPDFLPWLCNKGDTYHTIKSTWKAGDDGR